MDKTKEQTRAAGILLHPSSLPGPYGIGDLGPAAYAWVDALIRAKQSWWQILPLSPTGYADSPYQCLSAFAGNANLISPDVLIQDGLLRPSDIPLHDFPAHWVNFGSVIPFKKYLLARAWENFQAGAAPSMRTQFEDFCKAEASWLEDFTLFMALKETHAEGEWNDWEPEELVTHQPAALAQVRIKLSAAINQHRFNQFLFFRQWSAIKSYANSRGVRLIGDVSIFVAHDSADVWAHPDLYHLDEKGQSKVVAGVPPDYFSPTGQLWGNPLYNWRRLRQTGYSWWIERLRTTYQLVDMIRLDHFIGFCNYWEIPAGNPTAIEGRWVKGPGRNLFNALRKALGDLPIIAEDLGNVTPEVDALRLRYRFPGIRVLQFAFAGAVEERFLPHNFNRNLVVYTGTHDNDATRGWFAAASSKDRDFMRCYFGQECRDDNISWLLIRLAWSSVAKLAIAPLQDVLSLGTESRMNKPGTTTGNWTWRFLPDQLTDSHLDRLAELTSIYNREAFSKA